MGRDAVHFPAGRPTAGFTLVEVLCSVVIMGILIMLFYSTFLSNWAAMDNYSTRAALWQDMDLIIDEVTLEARAASRIDVGPDQRSIDFVSNNAIVAVCAFDLQGHLTMSRAGVTRLLSTRIDSVVSSFEDRGGAVVIKLVLADTVFNRRVAIETSTEILPRNQ